MCLVAWHSSYAATNLNTGDCARSIFSWTSFSPLIPSFLISRACLSTSPYIVLKHRIVTCFVGLASASSQHCSLMLQAKMGDKSPSDSDVILPMRDPYMSQIVSGEKDYEFRKYRLKPSVKRIWFYRTAPHSSITHVCETLPARTRNPGDAPLEKDGLGNTEFNDRHKDWDGYDFAYKMVTVRALRRPITLEEMKEKHGFKMAPRGLVYLPKSINDIVELREQTLVRRLMFGLLLSLS